MSAESIVALKQELSDLSVEFEKIKAEINGQVMVELAKFGLQNLIANAENALREHHSRLQSRANFVAGQIQALEEVFGPVDVTADLSDDSTAEV